jgi:hypothetical protein
MACLPVSRFARAAARFAPNIKLKKGHQEPPARTPCASSSVGKTALRLANGCGAAQMPGASAMLSRGATLADGGAGWNRDGKATYSRGVVSNKALANRCLWQVVANREQNIGPDFCLPPQHHPTRNGPGADDHQHR